NSRRRRVRERPGQPEPGGCRQGGQQEQDKSPQVQLRRRCSHGSLLKALVSDFQNNSDYSIYSQSGSEGRTEAGGSSGVTGPATVVGRGTVGLRAAGAADLALGQVNAAMERLCGHRQSADRLERRSRKIALAMDG